MGIFYIHFLIFFIFFTIYIFLFSAYVKPYSEEIAFFLFILNPWANIYDKDDVKLIRRIDFSSYLIMFNILKEISGFIHLKSPLLLFDLISFYAATTAV